ncbi:MAG: TetR/AcrR family transcriptional regulator [Acidimicrobiales bacterium]|nr:TetR/AcrR family transcriptional regulator [Acidimicrobiales bacterium]MCB1016216.1 TetR/AcrR family transcriptional regulator [Acidimicrobiales bacterium]
MNPAAPAPRRTQEQRRAATRAALLEAALETLVEVGVAGFTTTEVVRRAGTSQGALFKHFPTKADLWTATIEHLFAALRDDWERELSAVAPAERSAHLAVDLLWRQMHDVRIGAAFELYTVARTDPTLRASLEPVVRDHVARLHGLSRLALPDDLGDADALAGLVDLVVLAIQGLVIDDMAAPDHRAGERLLATIHALVDGVLDAPPPG